MTNSKTEYAEEERNLIIRLSNLYVGQLTPDEMAVFDSCVERGLAKYDYSHSGGALGLAKVKWVGPDHE